MRIELTSILVDDQERARRFYTEVLGFVVKHDEPVGDGRWLTVVSPEVHPDVELLLEPLGLPEAKEFQRAVYARGIPMAAFAVDDIEAEVRRLRERGVVFRSGPEPCGDTLIATFEDTCGNLIQIYQHG